MPNSLAIITICKGRLDHLRETLPRFVASGLAITVVDYDCPQQTADYVGVNFPSVRVVAVKDRPNWNPGEARNLGVQGITQDFLLFLDADIVLDDGFDAFLSGRALSEDEFFWGPPTELQFWGQCLVPRRRFEAIGGYDEAIVGWGYEDEDLYRRLRFSALREVKFPTGLFRALPHGDELRTQFHAEQRRWISQRINSIYSLVKVDMENLDDKRLSLESRQRLRTQVESLVTAAAASSEKDEPLEFEVQLNTIRSVAPLPYRCKRGLKYSLSIE